MSQKERIKVLLFTNTAWSLYNFRLPLARKLHRDNFRIVMVSADDEFSRKLAEEGVEFYPIPLDRSIGNIFKEFRSLLELWRIYRKVRPDIAHHFTMKGVLYGSTAGHLAGVRNIVNSITGRGPVFEKDRVKSGLLNLLLKAWHRVALRKTKLIFQNPDDQELFIRERFIRPGQGCLIPGSGVDIDEFRPSESSNAVPVVLLAGRMLWTKGVGEFVEAARIIRKKNLKVRFILAGQIDEDVAWGIPGKGIRSWEREGIIEWWGFQARMSKTFDACDVFCLPSSGWEGIPKVLIEAAAAGKPIVTTDHPGCRETVINGRNGFLVPIHSPRALAEALERLIGQPQLRADMGKNSRKLAEQLFSLDKIVQSTIEVYQEVLQRP